jgi:hypothetical protein
MPWLIDIILDEMEQSRSGGNSIGLPKKVHRRYSPYTAFSLASLPHRIFEYGLVARLTAALSTGNLDDATGSIDDIPKK